MSTYKGSFKIESELTIDVKKELNLILEQDTCDHFLREFRTTEFESLGNVDLRFNDTYTEIIFDDETEKQRYIGLAIKFIIHVMTIKFPDFIISGFMCG